jgi:hypothetical protein
MAAIVAVTLAIIHVESAHSAAIVLVVVCISCLAYMRYSESISLSQERGSTTNPSHKIRIFLASVTIATIVIGLSDLAFLIGYYGYLRVADAIILTSHATPSSIPGHMMVGWVFGILLALSVASCLRRTVWIQDRRKSWPARRCLKLWWPVGLLIMIGLLLVVDYEWERYSFCVVMAEYHTSAESKSEGLKKTALHAWLKDWYKRAAIRPWLPVHPDRLLPGMEE